MREKLIEFREALARHSPNALSALKPGLSEERILDRLEEIPFKLPRSVVELYTWADGEYEQPLEMLPGAYFMPFETVVDEFLHLLPMRDEFEDIFPQQYRDSFRFLSDWSDGGYAFGSLDPPCNGRIVGLCIHEEWQIAFSSLEVLIDTAIRCQNQGVFTNPKMPDYDKYYQIGRELNPDLDYWSIG